MHAPPAPDQPSQYAGHVNRGTAGVKSYPREFYRSLADGAARSAEVIVPIVLRLVDVRAVVDVGCGLGSWLLVFQRLGINDVIGIDGDDVDSADLVLPAERFVRRDLTQSLDVGRGFDLAVSLEVAEHLPPSRADTFVESLARLAPVVLFSAAIPFQGGFHHVNEQWPEYWLERFIRYGFLAIDAIRPEVWQDDRVDWWYAQNTLLFVRRDMLDHGPALARALEHTDVRRLAVVHPRNYARTWQSDR